MMFYLTAIFYLMKTNAVIDLLIMSSSYLKLCFYCMWEFLVFVFIILLEFPDDISMLFNNFAIKNLVILLYTTIQVIGYTSTRHKSLSNLWCFVNFDDAYVSQGILWCFVVDVCGKCRWKLKSEIDVDSELIALLHKEPNTNERIAAHEFFVTLVACSIVIPMLIQMNI
jgi:hypothetical protein